jgi:hypothetical protein
MKKRVMKGDAAGHRFSTCAVGGTPIPPGWRGKKNLREEFPQCRTGCKPVLRRVARAL